MAGELVVELPGGCRVESGRIVCDGDSARLLYRRLGEVVGSEDVARLERAVSELLSVAYARLSDIESELEALVEKEELEEELPRLRETVEKLREEAERLAQLLSRVDGVLVTYDIPHETSRKTGAEKRWEERDGKTVLVIRESEKASLIKYARTTLSQSLDSMCMRLSQSTYLCPAKAKPEILDLMTRIDNMLRRAGITMAYDIIDVKLSPRGLYELLRREVEKAKREVKEVERELAQEKLTKHQRTARRAKAERLRRKIRELEIWMQRIEKMLEAQKKTRQN